MVRILNDCSTTRLAPRIVVTRTIGINMDRTRVWRHLCTSIDCTPQKIATKTVNAQSLFVFSEHWSLTSLQQRLVKTGGRLVKHARYYWLLLAEGHLNRRR